MRYSKLPLPELIQNLLQQGKEGDFWDFKQEWHSKTEDLIKDIICFSNTVHDEDCFLIFGISDDLTVKGMTATRKKQADILDTLSHLVFAGDNLPHISVNTIEYDGKKLDVLRVLNTDKTPIYLNKPYGKMKEGCIYARSGDRNTPDNGNAEIEITENLWRKRFGLAKSPLEFIFDVLERKQDWIESENGYYYIIKPEYAIERCEDGDVICNCSNDEFYSYAQTNQATTYYMLEIKANGTTLEKHQIVNLDSGRLSIPVPEWGYVYFDDYQQDIIGYKYYIKDNHTERLMRFMYDPQDGDQRWAFNKLEAVTLFFESDCEKTHFEDYVALYRNDLIKRVNSSTAYDYIVTENTTKTTAYKRKLKTAVILKEMLNEYRAVSKKEYQEIKESSYV